MVVNMITIVGDAHREARVIVYWVSSTRLMEGVGPPLTTAREWADRKERKRRLLW